MLIIVSQKLPPTYIGVGHNYRWNEEDEKYEELFRSKHSDAVILWHYINGKIEEEITTKPHWVDGDWARGRIETGYKRGSITFNTDNPQEQKQVLNELVSKYPNVLFGVYARGGPYSVQQYWEKFLHISNF